MNSKISAKILSLMATGMSLEDAINTVFAKALGPNAYERIAGELYDALRAVRP